MQEAHETALQGALDVYNREAVGLGASRLKHEKLLATDLKKRYEVSSTSTFTVNIMVTVA